MYGIKISLSPPEAVHRLEDVMEAVLEFAREVMPEVEVTIDKKAIDFGFHRIDAEAALERVLSLPHIQEAFNKKARETKPSIDQSESNVTSNPNQELFIGPHGMNFILIPAGPFVMGSPLTEPSRADDETQYQVTINQPFHMQTTPVTQSQWQAIMDTNPSTFNL